MASNVISLFGAKLKAAPSAKKVDTEKVFGQMSLPFFSSRLMLFSMSNCFKQGNTFEKFVTASHVQVVLDMRLAPRLEFAGSSRAKAFVLFDALGVEYKDMFGRASLNSYEESSDVYNPLWNTLIATLDLTNGAVLTLFDDVAFMRMTGAALKGSCEVVEIDEAVIFSQVQEVEDLLSM